jgi:hypothetical protein
MTVAGLVTEGALGHVALESQLDLHVVAGLALQLAVLADQREGAVLVNLPAVDRVEVLLLVAAGAVRLLRRQSVGYPGCSARRGRRQQPEDRDEVQDMGGKRAHVTSDGRTV